MLRDLNIPLALVKIEISAQSDQLLQKLQVDRSTSSLVAVTRDFSTMEIISSVPSREEWTATIKDFIWKKSGILVPNKKVLGPVSPSGEKKSIENKAPNKKSATRKEITARYRTVILVTACLE